MMNLKTSNDRRGSSTIFLVMVLSSMLLVTMALIQATLRISGESTGQSVALLAGRSLLTEFDKNLKEDYGLFAFRGEPGQLAESMAFYAEPFYQENPYYRLGEIGIDVTKHRLTNPSNFQDAIVEYTMFATTKGILNQMVDSDTERSNAGNDPPVYSAGRTLRNQKVIESLPSASLSEDPGILGSAKEGLNNWRETFKNTTEAFFVNQYIMLEFKNAMRDIPGRDTFFNYEAEYILKGTLDDWKNKTQFRRDLLLLRNVVNLTVIYTTPQMRQKVVTAAELLTPGPAAIATQIIIAEAWALAESENDVRLLEHGKMVPLQKNTTTWAVDIQSVLEGKEQGYIDTKATNGLDYQGYLQIFLFFQNKDVKLTRIMDLIQINIQGNYDKTFLMCEHQTGLSYEMDINYFFIHGETQY